MRFPKPTANPQILKLVLLFSLLSSQLSLAADTAIYSHKSKGAIKGADAVAYFSLTAGDKAVIGSNQFTHEWLGATWRFISAENRDEFAANPEAYAPQYGGYCAYAVSHGFTKPVNPDKWKIVDGKLYLNLNGIAYRRWQKDQDAAIVRANTNWPTVLTACEENDNCNQ